MTEPEIIAWLGYRPEDVSGRVLLPQIVNGMKDVSMPASDAEHIEVFKAYLECAPPKHHPVFLPQVIA
jgi:hypothetical protein